MAMRMAGATFERIGEELGISRQAAWNLVRSGVEQLAEEVGELAARAREVELARLDMAQAAIWGQVLSGDLQAIDRFIKISERRGRLAGLDYPQRLEVSGEAGKPVSFVLHWREYPADEKGEAGEEMDDRGG